MGGSKNQSGRTDRLPWSARRLRDNGSPAKREERDGFVRPRQIFIATVNYDDPTHRLIDYRQYTLLSDGIKPADLPIRRQGQAEVEFGYLKFGQAVTARMVFQETERQAARRPDLAEARDFKRPFAAKGHGRFRLVSFFGSPPARMSRMEVACLAATEIGFALYRVSYDKRWAESNQFLMVRQPC